jgi:hypothetical protein
MRHMKNSCGTYRHTFAFNFLQCEPKAAHGPTNINTTAHLSTHNLPGVEPNHRHHGIFVTLLPPQATKPPQKPPCVPSPATWSLAQPHACGFHHQNQRLPTIANQPASLPKPLVNERCTNGHAGVGVIGTFFCSICTHISYEIISQMK